MTEKELQEFLVANYPKEDEKCDWKEMKNLKNSFNGHEGDDVISYVSGIANMEGGVLVIGVMDKTLDIVCTNISSEGLNIDEYITSDSHKMVWVIHIPKHLPRKPVYAHKKAWQRIKDNLVHLTPEREGVILSEGLL